MDDLTKNSTHKCNDTCFRYYPLLSFASLIFTASILGWLFYFARYGYDFVDESYYMNWMARPFNYSVSTTQFGFMYHPFYQLFNGNIATLRQANIATSFGLGVFAVWALLGRVFGAQTINSLGRFAISAALATSTFLSFVLIGWWLPTPSYNSLVFQGLLVAATGLILADRTTKPKSILGWALIAIGGWLTFMGKPTSAAALAVISAIYLLLSGEFRVKHILVVCALTLALLILSALLIDGSIMAFIERLRNGAAETGSFHGRYTFAGILRLEDLLLQENTKSALFFMAATVFCAIWLTWVEAGKFALLAQILSATGAALGVLIIGQYLPLQLISGEHRALLIFSAPLAVAFAGIFMALIRDRTRIAWSQWVLFLALLLFPYAFAFGTGNNYWSFIGSAAVFVVLSALIVLGLIAMHPKLVPILLVFGISLQTMVVLQVIHGLASPYAQKHPLVENVVAIDVGVPGASLILPSDHVRYISFAQKIADRAGFIRGTPVIDLSGLTPGFIYALGGNAIGMAWTIGGQPGTREYVIQNLRRVPCDQLAVAWVLAEARGPIAIPAEVLASFGANLPVDFEMVGTIKSPELGPAFGYSGGRQQELYKPSRSREDAIAACETVKRSSS